MRGIEAGLIDYIKKAAAETKKSRKYIPIVEYTQAFNSYSFAYEKMAVQGAIYILPVIWKYQRGAGKDEMKARLKELLDGTSFAKSDLAKPIDYFFSGIESGDVAFSSDNYSAGEYWNSVRQFSLADYRRVVSEEIRLLSFNKINDAADNIDYGNGAILLSWSQYRLNNYEAARKSLYKNVAGACGSFFDYSYKSKILFEGRISEFYHPAFYNFFDGGILFASIKSNNGDCSKVVKDIFDYLTILHQ